MPNGGFAPRSNFGAVVANGQLWVIGGIAHEFNPSAGRYVNAPANDVWTTNDGNTWSEATGTAAFEARSDFGIAASDDRIWIMGGNAISRAIKNDVWYSRRELVV